MGGRPVLADFGLYGQLKELLSDPTPGAYLREHATYLVAYVTRMESPCATGEIEPFSQLRDSLSALLHDEIATCFLPWSAANAQAIQTGQPSFTVMLNGQAFTQEPQKYHAKSLAEIRKKFAQTHDAQLTTLMRDTGCFSFL